MVLLFGKNLKKIRSVHGMSQQEFADVFDLKRGTLGAYEEGRSNPKLETVLKIANHFSIGLEELLMKELTVNKLLKFNELLAVESDSINIKDFNGIPCVLTADKSEFIKKYSSEFDFNNFPVIKIPNIDSENNIAFSVDDLSMTGGTIEFFPKDIIIGAKVDSTLIENKSLVVVLIKNELLFRKLYKEGNNFILKADHHGVADCIFSMEEIIYIWKIVHTIQYGIHSKEIFLENRLAIIEQSLALLKDKNHS